MKAQKYGIDEIFEKNLLFLIPFYIFSYESRFEEYNSDKDKLATLKAEYADIMARLNQLLENGSISACTRKIIMEMSDLQIAIKELLEEGRIAKSSISEALNRLSDCFASAVNNRYMLTNPAHDLVVPFKEEPWKERRWLNVDEIKIFLDETKESYPFWLPLHYIMIYTGMRIGEVGGLKWGDVHLEGGYIELKQALSVEYKQGKNLISLTTLKTTNSYRKIPFMGQVKEMFLQQKEQVELLKRELKDRYRGKGEFEDLVFVTTLGSPLIRHNAEKTINKVVDSINTKEAYEAKREQREPVLFERVYPHALRHTFASICYAAKMDVKTTQKLMGHAKISTTMDIYTHLDEMFLEDDITKFNEYILKGK